LIWNFKHLKEHESAPRNTREFLLFLRYSFETEASEIPNQIAGGLAPTFKRFRSEKEEHKIPKIRALSDHLAPSVPTADNMSFPSFGYGFDSRRPLHEISLILLPSRLENTRYSPSNGRFCSKDVPKLSQHSPFES
jgi:hypothetical protein